MRLLKISILIFVFISFGNAQWQTLNTGLPYRLESVNFINDNLGWILGNNHNFLRTVNGGLTWFNQPYNESWSIYDFAFINDTLGWAHGIKRYEGVNIVLKSKDGGQSWLINKEILDTNIISIFPIDENTIYALLGDNTLIKSEDSGNAWFNSHSFAENQLLNSIWFFNNDTGIVVGNYTIEPYEGLVYKTYDGGTHWELKIFPDFKNIRLLKFINDSTGYFVANDDNFFELFCETRDSGNSWGKKSENDSYTADYCFMSDDTLYAISGRAIVIGINNNIIKSTNSGETWDKVESISDWHYTDIVFTKNGIGYITGLVPGEMEFGGILLKSTDNGINWSNSILTYPFLSVHFIDQNSGFATGGVTEIHFEAGDIFNTNDGGKTWTVNFNPGKKISKCIFIDDSTGFAISDSWQEESNLYKTTDGAFRWNVINDLGPGETPFTVYDIYFNNTDLWIAGKIMKLPQYKSVIYRSTDKGKTWIKSWENPNHESFVFNSLHFTNSNTGWAVGANGLMMKYSAPEWDIFPTITDLPLTKVFFINENTGWISGGFYNYNHSHKFLWKKTSNGGSTWEDVEIGDYFIEDIEFKDQNIGWAVGFDSLSHGILLGTDDGGNSWIVQKSELDAALHDLHYRDGYVWAVGNLGLVLRSDGTSWIEQNNNSFYVTGFQLYQNFPNPFNPVTTISYVTGANHNLPLHVNLSIYNIIGQKVATLVSKKQSPGNYSVQWDASGFASGVYIYRISAGTFSDVKKMILIK